MRIAAKRHGAKAPLILLVFGTTESRALIKSQIASCTITYDAMFLEASRKALYCTVRITLVDFCAPVTTSVAVTVTV